MTEKSQNKPEIYYIDVPPTYTRSIGDFTLDPSLPLPVEAPSPGERLPVEDLSWEMIVAGMLRVLQEEPEGSRSTYYRNFIMAVKPQIYQELTTSGIYKARNKDYPLAAEIFDILEALDPGNPRTLINQALLLEERAAHGDGQSSPELANLLMEKAETYYQRALAAETVLPDALLNAGFFYKNRGDFAQAAQLLQQYLQEGDDEQKLAEVRQSLSQIEGERESDDIFQEARKLMEGDKPSEAVNPIKEYLAKSPQDPRGHFILGWALRRLGRYKEADTALTQAEEIASQSAAGRKTALRELLLDILNERAICALEGEDPAEAEALLQRALRLQPDNIKIISNLGSLALKAGREEEGIQFFQTVLALEPEDPVAREIVERYLG